MFLIISNLRYFDRLDLLFRIWSFVGSKLSSLDKHLMTCMSWSSVIDFISMFLTRRALGFFFNLQGIMKLHRKTFYYTLKNGPLEEFVGERPIVQRNDKGKRSFASFVNWQAFFRWYTSLREEDRVFSEVIPEGKQKFRLDIDALCVDKNSYKEEKNKILEKLNQITLFLNQRSLIYESVDPLETKISYHVVFPELILDSSFECREMFEELKERLSLEEIYDESVYKKLQCFRIEGSRKDDSNRYKYLVGETNLSESFFDGLITFF